MEGLFQQIIDLGEEEENAVASNVTSTFSSSALASAFSGAMTSAFSGTTMHTTPGDQTAAAAITTTPKARGSASSSPTSAAAARNEDTPSVEDRHRHSAASEDVLVPQLRHTLQLQKKRYDELLADSHSLRSEYDAYQLRMEHVMRHYKQQVLQDKHMMEELRLAGATGSLDEAYVTGMKRQMGELQRQLKESMSVAEKAYQRQREAEEARAATERAKREELEALALKIAHFHAASSAPEAELNAEAVRSPATAGAAATSGSEEQQLDEEEAEHGEGKESTETKPASVSPSSSSAALLRAEAQLALRQAEIDELRAQLQRSSTMHQHMLEEQKQDTDTLRAEIDQYARRESAQKASHAAALKKTEAQYAEKEAALRRELETAREHVQKASAEQSSQRVTQELLATQEREHEARLETKEREMQALRTSLQALQSAVEAAHAELREIEMTLHDTQRENRQLQGKADQVGADLVRSEQQLALREDDMLDAEKERQKLRALLRQEEEETLRVRQQLSQLQRVEAERGVGTAGDKSADDGARDDSDAEGHATRLTSIVAAQRQTIQTLQSRIEMLESEITTREAALRRQHAQAQEISTARIEFMKSKEEANARVEQYKDKISRLEGELAMARKSGATAAAAAVSALSNDDGRNAVETGLLSSQMERHQFLLEAKRSADSYRLSRVRQMRLAFFAVLLLVVGMTLYASFSLAPPPPERY